MVDNVKKESPDTAIPWGEDFTCVICKREIEGEWGNNPWPLAEEGECCNVCNTAVVAHRLQSAMKR